MDSNQRNECVSSFDKVIDEYINTQLKECDAYIAWVKRNLRYFTVWNMGYIDNLEFELWIKKLEYLETNF